MLLAWGQHVDQKFRDKTLVVVSNLNWQKPQASDLMSCMAWETGQTFSPSVRNGAGSGAVGLIQFMPGTAADMGTSTEELSQMTAVDQLDYVEKYFRPYASRIHTLDDMYMAILMPKYISADDSAVVFENGHIAYRQNRGFDANHDGQITKAEVCAKVQAVYERGKWLSNAINL